MRLTLSMASAPTAGKVVVVKRDGGGPVAKSSAAANYLNNAASVSANQTEKNKSGPGVPKSGVDANATGGTSLAARKAAFAQALQK